MKTKLYHYGLKLKNSPGMETPLVRWGVLFSLLIILENVLIEPYFSWRQQQLNLIQAHSRQIAALTALQKSIKAWQSALKLSNLYLKQNDSAFINAPSYALAQQKMYNRLQTEVTQQQLKMDSQRLLAAKTVALGEQIGLQLNLSGQMLHLIDFLDVIAHAPELFTVEKLILSQSQTEATLNITLSSYRLQRIDPSLAALP
jgi:hypothetical protein